tara:strand:+ start:1146 stop:1523 length:378 start_codon:yes stop_codon:yes gene_type:complete
MRNYRNNNPKRNRFRSIDRGFRRNNDNKKFDNNNDVSSNLNFIRKSPGKNNHNASKLVEKYNDLAREALSYGDKILSENYFQHADHFLRVLAEQENLKINKTLEKNKIEIVAENDAPEKNSVKNT